MSMIDIKDAPEKAKRIFGSLIDAFEEQNVSPTPLNYYVWYQYYKGDIPKFRQEMDSILNDPFGYNDRVGKRLYEEYLADNDDDDSGFDRAFRRLIEMMVLRMDSWSDKLKSHTDELDACSSKLADPTIDASEVKRITDSVLSTATSMKESSRAFQDEMLTTSESVKKLRQELIEAKAEALTDELTEIGNRKAFNNAIQELMLDASSNPNGLCLVMSDIDHFKVFNDTYGHLVGDSVLRYFANVMKKGKGDNETICRYGGEEFAILFANSSIEEATERAEEIRVGIEAAHLKRKNSNEPLKTITSSFGVACYHGNEDAQDFIHRADKALYLAKESGRNQIINETELPEETPSGK